MKDLALSIGTETIRLNGRLQHISHIHRENKLVKVIQFLLYNFNVYVNIFISKLCVRSVNLYFRSK